jgi:hypothetical protein
VAVAAAGAAAANGLPGDGAVAGFVNGLPGAAVAEAAGVVAANGLPAGAAVAGSGKTFGGNRGVIIEADSIVSARMYQRQQAAQRVQRYNRLPSLHRQPLARVGVRARTIPIIE